MSFLSPGNEVTGPFVIRAGAPAPLLERPARRPLAGVERLLGGWLHRTRTGLWVHFHACPTTASRCSWAPVSMIMTASIMDPFALSVHFTGDVIWKRQLPGTIVFGLTETKKMALRSANSYSSWTGLLPALLNTRPMNSPIECETARATMAGRERNNGIFGFARIERVAVRKICAGRQKQDNSRPKRCSLLMLQTIRPVVDRPL